MTPTCTTRLYIHSHFYSHAPSIPMQERARACLSSPTTRSRAFLSLFLFPSFASSSFFLFGEILPKQKSPRARDKIRHSGMQPGRETTRSNVPRAGMRSFAARRPVSLHHKRCPINLYVAVPPSRRQSRNMAACAWNLLEYHRNANKIRLLARGSFRFPI